MELKLNTESSLTLLKSRPMQPNFISATLIGTLSIALISPLVSANTEQTLQLQPTQPPTEDFFQPVHNLLNDLKNQGITVTDPADPLSLRYRITNPCNGCSVYLGTGVANPQKDVSNGMGVNLGLGFTLPISP
jgi:hypothetical protein